MTPLQARPPLRVRLGNVFIRDLNDAPSAVKSMLKPPFGYDVVLYQNGVWYQSVRTACNQEGAAVLFRLIGRVSSSTSLEYKVLEISSLFLNDWILESIKRVPLDHSYRLWL